MPFRSIPFHSIPFHSVLFCSVLFHSMNAIDLQTKKGGKRGDGAHDEDGAPPEEEHGLGYHGNVR